MKRTLETRTLKSLVAAGAIAASALTPMAAAPAAADGWHRGGSCVYRHGTRYCGSDHRRQSHNRHYRNDDGVAAAIIGLAGVAIVAGALSQANQPAPREYYAAPDAYPPAPTSSGPNVITYDSTLEPWTTGWYQWCDARYRTFNAKTGTYHGYDGRDHFCVPK